MNISKVKEESEFMAMLQCYSAAAYFSNFLVDKGNPNKVVQETKEMFNRQAKSTINFIQKLTDALPMEDRQKIYSGIRSAENEAIAEVLRRMCFMDAEQRIAVETAANAIYEGKAVLSEGMLHYVQERDEIQSLLEKARSLSNSDCQKTEKYIESLLKEIKE